MAAALFISFRRFKYMNKLNNSGNRSSLLKRTTGFLGSVVNCYYSARTCTRRRATTPSIMTGTTTGLSAERLAGGGCGTYNLLLLRAPAPSLCHRFFTISHSHPMFSARRFESTEVELVRLDHDIHQDDEEYDDHGDHEGTDFPGGKVTFTSEMSFSDSGSCPEKRITCYRVLDQNGQLISRNHCDQVCEELAVKMYNGMVTLQIMDSVLYESQRQGRISFYVTSYGEEAVNIASAAVLKEKDAVFAQYRDPGVLLWRGFTLQGFTNQCFRNKADYGKGRQMPIHYGSRKHNYFTISSPIATQLPQAVGAAYSLKIDNKDACAVAYMGDGCTSEGDFHASLNFAAVLDVPLVFICRNNGWAISTPTTEQFRSDGVVVKGPAYGIRSIRVDGNDALAIYNVVQVAREMAVCERRPILIEALTYRLGHHSTSDDSTKYRPLDEIEHWKMARNPIGKI
ncbi:hypothetical protein Ancab_037419 [Ancistrocladus abbreviatus]